MTRGLILALLLTAMLVTVSAAEDSKRDEKKIEIHFLNGSIVRLAVQSEALEVATRYGKLTVPIEEIRSIDFGLHLPDGFAAKIEHAVKQLASANYRERENAGKTLIELGPFSYPAVLKAMRDKDLEASSRAKEIVKKLRTLHPKHDLKTVTDDKLVTATFTIVGRIVTPSIKVQEEYFGDAVLSLAKMRTLRARMGRFKEVELTIDAAKYGTAGQWLETSFQIDGKRALIIAAKGLVDLAPQQGGQMVGPAGMPGRRGKGGFGGAAGFGGGGFPGAGAAGGAVIAPRYGGMLFGKIGENGDPFIIGERYEGAPETEGKLYLHIAPSPYNAQSTGSYQVTISPKDY